MANAAMNPKMPNTAIAAVGFGSDSCQATRECMATIAAAPIIMRTRRPTLSITANAIAVKTRFTSPMPIVPARAASDDPSPNIIWKIRGA